jgi:NAD(P)-dependent dehydrogenase (short-subunit alcohol dehydrogenase family)
MSATAVTASSGARSPTALPRLAGRWAVVTGGTRGIGLAVARGLVTRGARVILVGRDRNAGTAALAELRGFAGDEAASWLGADLASRRAVRALAARILETAPRLDLLVLNAAVVTPTRILTPDGHEMQLAVNHLAPYLLTHDLLPLLSDGGRIVVTASQVERGARLDLDDLDCARAFEPTAAYARTKLANVLFTYELAERLQGTSVTANCLHPGVVRTGLLDTLERIDREREPQAPAARRAVGALRHAVGQSLRGLGLLQRAPDWAIPAEDGAAMTLTVATDPSLAGVSGGYFRDGAQAESSPASRDVALRRALWDASAALVGVSPDWPRRVEPSAPASPGTLVVR